MTESYRVVFLGGGEQATPAEVKEKIARLFRMSEDKVEQLLLKAPIVVKNGVSRELAEKLVAALEGCGARARFEPMSLEMAEQGATASDGQLMVCPACGQNQPQAETCIFCGKVVAKVQEAIRRQQEEAGERRRKPRVMPEIKLRPMTVGDMLSESFAMLREKMATFAGITVLIPTALTLVAVGVFGLLLYAYITSCGGFQAVVMAAASGGSCSLPVSPGPMILLIAGVGMSILFVQLWMHSSLTYAISERHLGHHIGVLASFRYALGRMPSLYWTGLSTSIIVAAVFIGLCVPALLFFGPLAGLAAVIATGCFALRYALVEKVVVLEGLTGGEARARSKELVSGNALRLIGIVLVFGGVVVLVKLALNIVGPLLEPMPLPIQLAGELAVGIVLGTFGTAFPSMGLCLFYYDVRLRADGELTFQGLARNL